MGVRRHEKGLSPVPRLGCVESLIIAGKLGTNAIGLFTLIEAKSATMFSTSALMVELKLGG